MLLQLRSLVPVPLRDKIGRRPTAIWDQDLEFRNPEYVFLQAPSGTGKTTLIHSLYGLRRDYTGTVSWDGHELRSISSEDLALLRAGSLSVIFQDMRLFPGLSAWENLELKRSLTDTISKEELTDWMLRLGIGDKKESLAATLSYGEQQRVAILRALLQPFSWLLMDEPFSHLDQHNTGIAAALILEQVRRNKAGLLLADLDENTFFPYTQTLHL